MQRLIGLTGTVNFRDMGGYLAEGGRRVRWKTLYRSGTVHRLTADDRSILATIPIRTVFDLRSNAERQDYPHAFATVAGVEYHKRDHATMVGNIGAVLRQRGPDRATLLEDVVRAYDTLAYSFSASYRSILDCAAYRPLPLLVNCAAGKDRTGVAAAILLTALGVAWADVMDDYLLTEHAVPAIIAQVRARENARFMAGWDDGLLMPLFTAQADYLNAMRDSVVKRSGSMEAYLTNELRVTPEMTACLRDRLLVDADAEPMPQTA